MKVAKEEHAKAYEAAKVLAESSPENEVVVPHAIHSYHASPSYIANHPIAYTAPLVTSVKTIVPSSFAYSVHTTPQITYAHHLPYVITA